MPTPQSFALRMLWETGRDDFLKKALLVPAAARATHYLLLGMGDGKAPPFVQSMRACKRQICQIWLESSLTPECAQLAAARGLLKLASRGAGQIRMHHVDRLRGRHDVDARQPSSPPPRPEELEESGISTDHIHTESFHQGGQQASPGTRINALHEITFSRSGKTLQWDSEYRNLLEFAESNGITMEAGCMFGECGACSILLQDGEVAYNHPTASKPQAGHCLPCSCRPDSSMSIDA